jgi:hypothetical protein
MRRDLVAYGLAVLCLAVFATGCGSKPKPPEDKPPEGLDITGPMDPTPMPTPMPMPGVTPQPEPGPAPGPKDPAPGVTDPAPKPDPEPKPLVIPPPDDPAKPGTAAARPLEKAALDAVVAKLGEEADRDAAISELKARGPAVVNELTAALGSAKPEAQARIAFALGALGKDAAPALATLKQLAAGPEGSPARDSALFAIEAIEAK